MVWAGVGRAESPDADPTPPEISEQAGRAAPEASGEMILNLPTPPEEQLRGADIKVHSHGAPGRSKVTPSPRAPGRIPTHRTSSPGDGAGIRTHRMGEDDPSEIRTHGLWGDDSSGIKIHR